MRIHTVDADACVRQSSSVVPEEEIQSKEMQQFYSDLIQAMIDADGIGIAATQVGRPIRVFVVSKEYTEDNEHLVLINPRCTSHSGKTWVMDEGCLSVPGTFGPVERSFKVRCKGTLPTGEKADIKAKGMLARIVQHEIDHLDATLFIDRATELTSTRSQPAAKEHEA